MYAEMSGHIVQSLAHDGCYLVYGVFAAHTDTEVTTTEGSLTPASTSDIA